MEQSNSNQELNPKDPWSINPRKASESQKEETEENQKQEEETNTPNLNDLEEEQSVLKAAMVDWRKKGNTLLADACADALDEIDEQQEEALQTEAPEESSTPMEDISPSLQTEAPEESSTPMEDISPSLQTEAPEESSTPMEDISPSLQTEAPEESSTPLEETLPPKIFIAKNQNIEPQKLSYLSQKVAVPKILKDTKLILRLVGYISIFEFFRLFYLLLIKF